MSTGHVNNFWFTSPALRFRHNNMYRKNHHAFTRPISPSQSPCFPFPVPFFPFPVSFPHSTEYVNFVILCVFAHFIKSVAKSCDFIKWTVDARCRAICFSHYRQSSAFYCHGNNIFISIFPLLFVKNHRIHSEVICGIAKFKVLTIQWALTILEPSGEVLIFILPHFTLVTGKILEEALCPTPTFLFQRGE